MARKKIREYRLRFYEGDEALVQFINALINDNKTVVNEYLKEIISKEFLDEDEQEPSDLQSQPIDTEGLLKELLPEIRKVVEAAVDSALATHTISSEHRKSELDEDMQSQIQDGLKQLGQSMME
jgi:hypothetical protein